MRGFFTSWRNRIFLTFLPSITHLWIRIGIRFVAGRLASRTHEGGIDTCFIIARKTYRHLLHEYASSGISGMIYSIVTIELCCNHCGDVAAVQV